MKISFFKSVKNKAPHSACGIDDYLDAVKCGKWEDEVLAVRTGKADKSTVPAVTPSGTFHTRNSAGLIEHSGFVCIDVDAKDQVVPLDMAAMREDRYTYAMHQSVSGNGGVAILVRIDAKRHADAFEGLRTYYLNRYQVVIDPSCRDITRARFVSYDPDLYRNTKALIFKEYIKKKDKPKIEPQCVVVKDDFDFAVNQAANMNLFDDYSDYISCAFALSHEFGEGGRHYFHTLCSGSSKYDPKIADRQFDIALSRRVERCITIGWLKFKFHLNGVKWESKRTAVIRNAVKFSDNPKQHLEEQGVVIDDDVMSKFLSSNDEKEETEIQLIINLIRTNGIKFNEITRDYEIHGKPLDDRALAKIYTKAWETISPKLSKDKVWTLIQNHDVTPTYNPIMDWFEKNKDLPYNGEYERLCECFELNQVFDNGELVADFHTHFLKKWLMGLVASAHGVYSITALVLVGAQGTHKTTFFRELLPEELRPYYAESNLDEGKDSEILMCKKWLIVDDEFGGKSKKDATKLKRLTSQQTFSIRMPYGRMSEDLNRLAVLAGTSNDNEVINDPTGNRRIIPLNVHTFDITKYRGIDKGNLFAWLLREFKTHGNAWHLTVKDIEALNRSTTKNTEIMTEKELIERIFEPYAEGTMTTSDIMAKLSNYYSFLRTNPKRVGQALKSLGYEQVVKKLNGNTARVYRITERLYPPQHSNPGTDF